jgi:hypothetical protein
MRTVNLLEVGGNAQMGATLKAQHGWIDNEARLGPSSSKKGVPMIHITVDAGQDVQARVNELYDAVREETRVWSMSDLRRTKNLKLIHSARNVKGIIRRVKADNPQHLVFECKAKDVTQEAITAGRFVHLILRYMPSASRITIDRK